MHGAIQETEPRKLHVLANLLIRMTIFPFLTTTEVFYMINKLRKFPLCGCSLIPFCTKPKYDLCASSFFTSSASPVRFFASCFSSRSLYFFWILLRFFLSWHSIRYSAKVVPQPFFCSLCLSSDSPQGVSKEFFQLNPDDKR